MGSQGLLTPLQRHTQTPTVAIGRVQRCLGRCFRGRWGHQSLARRLDKTRCSHLLFSSKRKKNVQFGHESWTREGEEACGGRTATLYLPRIPELACGSHLCLPPGPPVCSSGVERRRRGEPAGTASGAAHARGGARSVRPRRERILRTPRTGRRGASRGRRGGPKRGTHQNNRREQRLASCSGLGFTSVCTGSILPGVRAAGRARSGRVRGSGRRSRLRGCWSSGPARRSARRASQAAASGNRPALTPPPGTPRGARYAPPPPPPPGARELRVACEHSGRGRRVGNGGDHAQGTSGGPGKTRGRAARARDPRQTLPKFIKIGAPSTTLTVAGAVPAVPAPRAQKRPVD